LVGAVTTRLPAAFLLIHCHGVDGDPVERGERIAGALARRLLLLQRRRQALWPGGATRSPPGRMPSVARPRATQLCMTSQIRRMSRRMSRRTVFGCVGCVAATRALIAHHDLIDAQVVAFRHIQQLGSAAEGVGQRTGDMAGAAFTSRRPRR